MSVTVKQLADLVGGILEGDGNIIINSAAPVESAKENQISFIANSKYKKFLDQTTASAVVLPDDLNCDCPAVIRHKNPYYAFALILDELYPDTNKLENAIDETAVISDSAIIADNCTVGALSFVGDNTKLDNNTVIYPRVYLGNNVTIGKGCKLYPGVIINDDTKIADNVTIHGGTVIGADGFGYAQHDMGLKKVKQIGWVEIGDDSEIGANC
ncbi:MAG: UDP-3-O-(3-hydroxymyristoyl)glucosamine N-acyltransferase, partial [candidate division Zixibacteria bacterium]|nr:UDP-3-O-(3-hydroxymyristoyl)glucosamine N-acyltransferase [candidate division Zixibacteria bacterium]